MDLRQVRHLGEGLGVAEGHVDDAVVGEGRHGSDGSGLLTAAHGSGRDEEAGHLAPEATGGPLLAGLVPEGLYHVLSVFILLYEIRSAVDSTHLPLSGEVAVSGGDAQEESIVRLEGRGVFKDRDIGGLGRSVHLAQNLLGEGLRELEEVGSAAGLLDTGLLSLGQLLDVAVHRVL